MRVFVTVPLTLPPPRRETDGFPSEGEPRIRVRGVGPQSALGTTPLRIHGRSEDYFAWGGCIIDQPFQPRLPDGMIRCYRGVDKGRRLRPPIHQGIDHAAGRPKARRMGAVDDAGARPRCRVTADHLGRKFSVRATNCIGRRHLRVVRDQCQLDEARPRLLALH